jgi:hypothetical protein
MAGVIRFDSTKVQDGLPVKVRIWARTQNWQIVDKERSAIAYNKIFAFGNDEFFE